MNTHGSVSPKSPRAVGGGGGAKSDTLEPLGPEEVVVDRDLHCVVEVASFHCVLLRRPNVHVGDAVLDRLHVEVELIFLNLALLLEVIHEKGTHWVLHVTQHELPIE